MDIQKHNQEMMDKFGYMPLILTEIANKKIRSISFQPFEDMPVQRKYGIGNAYQIKESEEGLDIYYEPEGLQFGNRMIFIEDIPEKGIVKGDTGVLEFISASSNKFELTLDKRDEQGILKLVTGINSTSCVYDTEYKFAHFCKVSTSERKYFSGIEAIGYTERGHFTQDNNPIMYSIRYKGALTKELAEKMREQFEREKLGLVKLEQQGKFSFLLIDKYPNTNPKKSPTEMDAYRRPRSFSILKDYPLKNKPKI